MGFSGAWQALGPGEEGLVGLLKLIDSGWMEIFFTSLALKETGSGGVAIVLVKLVGSKHEVVDGRPLIC